MADPDVCAHTVWTDSRCVHCGTLVYPIMPKLADGLRRYRADLTCRCGGAYPCPQHPITMASTLITWLGCVACGDTGAWEYLTSDEQVLRCRACGVVWTAADERWKGAN